MRLLVVDDDPIVCKSLKTILEADPDILVAGICYDANEAIKLYDSILPDILLMDIRMKELNGLDAAQMILNTHKEAKILFLTTFSDTEYIIKALKIGAKGFILKQHFESIISALRAVMQGQRVFGDEIVTKIPELLAKEIAKDFSVYNLSEKEIQILKLIAEGFSNKEIAEILHFSDGTVRNYISVILEKLNQRDRTQLVAFYYRN